MNNVIIHFIDGGTTIIPESNIENTRRLLGSKIANIEFEDQTRNKEALIEAIDKDLIIEVVSNGALTMEDLLNTDKDVLRAMADKLSEEKAIAKANGRAGIEKLAEYIFLATN